LLNIVRLPAADIRSRSVTSDIISNLLSEVSPSKALIHRTKDGTNITAEQMIKFLREGSKLGEQYATSVLRAARDSLAQEAQKVSNDCTKRSLNLP
jgi:hypothetical protein